MEKRKFKRTAVFYPCTMGVFILLIIILSITAGLIRRELVLTLTGAALLAIWAYCLVMTLLMALFHRKRAKNIYINLEPERLVCGGQTNAVYRYNNDAYAEKSIFQFPGVLVRCRVLLNTMDGRRVTYDFKPENKTGLQQNFFQVKKRGAYYSAYDEFAVFDVFGFFRFAYRVGNNELGNSAGLGNSGAIGNSGVGNNGLGKSARLGNSAGVGNSGAIGNSGLGNNVKLGNTGALGYNALGNSARLGNNGLGNSGARLLVSPIAAAEPLFFMAKGGEANRQDTLSLERTDYLIDHRPYVPGDDPRRINWKLYGHGGELIVRQGEREPPPFSNLVILIDTQYDSLYSAKLGNSEIVNSAELDNSARLGNNGAVGNSELGNNVKLGNSAPQAAAHLAAVDLLCENALAIINNAGKEINIQIGFTGQSKKSGTQLTKAEMGFFLAYPAALPMATKATTRQVAARQKARQATTTAPFTTGATAEPSATLPAVPEDCGIVILALPRIETDNSALDKFLADNAGRQIELLFVYAVNGDGKDGSAGGGDSLSDSAEGTNSGDGKDVRAGRGDKAESARREKLATAATNCANFYNRRPGVRAQAVGILQ